MKHIKEYKDFNNESDNIEEVKKVPMIKDIIKKAKLDVKEGGIVKLDDKHVWLKKKSIVDAMQALKQYKTGVKEERTNSAISRFLINYDDGVDTLQVIYFRDLRRSS